MNTDEDDAISKKLDYNIESLNLGQQEEDLFDHLNEMTEDEKRQIEANKLASLCYCEKLNSQEENYSEGSKVDTIDESTEDTSDEANVRVKFADTVIVCPTYTSQVGQGW